MEGSSLIVNSKVAKMFNLSLDNIKQKTKDLIDSTSEVISDTVQSAKQNVSDVTQKTIEVTHEIAEKIETTVSDSNISEKTINKLSGILGTSNHILNKVKFKSEEFMEHKILMMGGRRAGKSTILSSILSQLDKNTPGTICTIVDNTDYTQEIETKDGVKQLPTLGIKQNEIRDYIKKRQMNTEFLVDMSPTYGKASYILEVSSDNTTIDLEFIDVPGEWMRANVKEHAELVALVEKSDVFVIVIDTPYLMNTNDDEGISINRVYNRVDEITQAMSKIKIDTENDLKQIILCPVKCEKWIREGKTDLIIEKVLKTYRNLINRWVSRPEITIQIMPIQTIGGLEFTRLLPAKLYFKNDDDRIGESCSIDPLTNTLTNKDGRVIRQSPHSYIEDDERWKIDYVDIPLSWYKLNGEGVKPRLCEQPGFHILKFLVEKEENAVKAKAEAERQKLDNMNPIRKWLTKTFKPTFGKYLPIWQSVISKLSVGGYIKTEGEGFCYVRNKID